MTNIYIGSSGFLTDLLQHRSPDMVVYGFITQGQKLFISHTKG